MLRFLHQTFHLGNTPCKTHVQIGAKSFSLWARNYNERDAQSPCRCSDDKFIRSGDVKYVHIAQSETAYSCFTSSTWYSQRCFTHKDVRYHRDVMPGKCKCCATWSHIYRSISSVQVWNLKVVFTSSTSHLSTKTCTTNEPVLATSKILPFHYPRTASLVTNTSRWITIATRKQT